MEMPPEQTPDRRSRFVGAIRNIAKLISNAAIQQEINPGDLLEKNRAYRGFIEGHPKQIDEWDARLADTETFPAPSDHDAYKRKQRRNRTLIMLTGSTILGVGVTLYLKANPDRTAPARTATVPNCMKALGGTVDSTRTGMVRIQAETDQEQAYTGLFEIGLPTEQIVAATAIKGVAYVNLPYGSYTVDVARGTTFSCSSTDQGVTNFGPGSIDTLTVPPKQ